MSPVVGRTVECVRVSAGNPDQRRAGAYHLDAPWLPTEQALRNLARVLQGVTTEVIPRQHHGARA